MVAAEVIHYGAIGGELIDGDIAVRVTRREGRARTRGQVGRDHEGDKAAVHRLARSLRGDADGERVRELGTGKRALPITDLRQIKPARLERPRIADAANRLRAQHAALIGVYRGYCPGRGIGVGDRAAATRARCQRHALDGGRTGQERRSRRGATIGVECTQQQVQRQRRRAGQGAMHAINQPRRAVTDAHDVVSGIGERGRTVVRDIIAAIATAGAGGLDARRGGGRAEGKVTRIAANGIAPQRQRCVRRGDADTAALLPGEVRGNRAGDHLHHRAVAVRPLVHEVLDAAAIRRRNIEVERAVHQRHHAARVIADSAAGVIRLIGDKDAVHYRQRTAIIEDAAAAATAVAAIGGVARDEARHHGEGTGIVDATPREAIHKRIGDQYPDQRHRCAKVHQKHAVVAIAIHRQRGAAVDGHAARKLQRARREGDRAAGDRQRG